MSFDKQGQLATGFQPTASVIRPYLIRSFLNIVIYPFRILVGLHKMIRSYATFTKANFSLLSYGIILMILSSPGQTLFISLFVDDFRDQFSISVGDVGTIFAVATFASALALPRLGERIDRTKLSTFTIGIGLLLALACTLLGLSPSSSLFFGICIFLLRLGGQGLMVHTAMTATARAFRADGGKAIAVVSLLYSAALIFIPAIAVSSIGFFGWRRTWLLTAAIVFIGVVLACRLLPRHTVNKEEKCATGPARESSRASPDLRLMLRACPVMLATSLIFTGLLFHQATLAGEKGWAFEWLAACFSAFAISQSATSFLAGPAIDKLSAVRVLPVFLLPLVIALGLVAFADGLWVAPFYMALLGISAAVDLKLGTILWSNLYGVEQLGYIRSRFEAIRIVVTGAAPLIVGKLLDLGIPLTRQAVGFACYTLCASGFAILLGRFTPKKS